MNLVPPSDYRRHIILYLQVHQPLRLRSYSFFDIGSGPTYFDDKQNKKIIKRVAKNCYLQANKLLLKLIQKHPEIKITFSISGLALEQFEIYAPDVIRSFQALVETGSVEFLAETYYHSLASVHPSEEFEIQIIKHAEKLYEHFAVRPAVFRNTELIYSDAIGHRVSRLGFRGILTEGIEQLLQNRDSHHVFQHPDLDLRLLLRDSTLSDDIAFRYAQPSWNGWPLTAEKFVQWLDDMPNGQEVVTLGMDYETFGEHHKSNTGIFKFFGKLLTLLARHQHLQLVTPSQAVHLLEPYDTLAVPSAISWADHERDLSAWLGNDLQRDAFHTIMDMENQLKNKKDASLLDVWRKLQASDHLYYMSTKNGSDQAVHSYFNPYGSPHEAFMNYMNVLADMSLAIKDVPKNKGRKKATYRLAEITATSLR